MKKSLSIILAVLLVLSSFSFAVAEQSETQPKVRLALVGAWHVHTNMFIKRLETGSAGKYEFVAVWDHDMERGKEFAEQLNVPFVEKLEDVLSNPDVDAVMIEAETNWHKELVIASADAGKAIFCEKVFATNIKDALEMKEAIERNGVKFVISHESVPTASYQYARKLIDEGTLGDIISVYFRRAHGMLLQGEGINGSLRDDWMDKATAGGGALMDLGVHGMSLLPFFAKSEPVQVSAIMKEWKDTGVDSAATIMMEFENGVMGVAHTDMISSIMINNLEILGERGQVLVVGNDVYLNALDVEGYEKGLTLIDPSVYEAESVVPLNWFIDFVLDTENKDQYLPYVGIEDALTVVRIAETAYQSYETDSQPVAFDKTWN